MLAERATTLNGRRIVIEDEAILALAGSLRGSLTRPGDAGYDEARQVWNGMIDKYPALVVRCAGTSDVVAAVNFARDHDLLVAVKGNGHNVAGNAVNDGGLLIDLSAMKGISVDPMQRIARAQPGASWGDLDRETQVHGLVTPGGQVSTTGIAGFTLGGGMGYLRRKWGLACDNLVAVEIVTAGSQVLTASESQHPDLFWAVRGGGGNFGIVTSFEFKLYALGPEIYGTATIYPFEEAATVLRGWRDYIAQAPDEVTCDVLVWGMPPLPDVPPEMHWAPVVIVAAMYAGPVEEGERELRAVRQFGTSIGDLSGPTTYVVKQSAVDALFPNGQQYYWKSLSTPDLRDEVIDALVELSTSRPSPQTMVALRELGGATGRVPEEATAYGNRAAQYNISIDNTWTDPADNERMIAWTRDAWSQLREMTGGGVYVNFAGLGEENDSLAHLIHGRNYDRLVAVKRRYDPTNFFRGNVNIVP
jgi:FAD/FMN-containing dehydrogenase